MKEQVKNKYSLYVNFESFMKLSESGLSEVGEYTVVGSTKGSKRVMVYSMFELTDEEYKAALDTMHRICDRMGHSYKAVNVLCEMIAFKMPSLLAAHEAERERKIAERIRRDEAAKRRLVRTIRSLIG